LFERNFVNKVRIALCLSYCFLSVLHICRGVTTSSDFGRRVIFFLEGGQARKSTPCMNIPAPSRPILYLQAFARCFLYSFGFFSFVLINLFPISGYFAFISRFTHGNSAFSPTGVASCSCPVTRGSVPSSHRSVSPAVRFFFLRLGG